MIDGYSPMASGLLQREHDRRADRRAARRRLAQARRPGFREPELGRNLALVDRLAAVAGRHRTVAGAVAIAWTLRNPAVDAAIVGFRSPEQVEPLVAAARIDLSDEDLNQIEGAH